MYTGSPYMRAGSPGSAWMTGSSAGKPGTASSPGIGYFEGGAPAAYIDVYGALPALYGLFGLAGSCMNGSSMLPA